MPFQDKVDAIQKCRVAGLATDKDISVPFILIL